MPFMNSKEIQSSNFLLTGIVIALSAFPFFTTGIEFNIVGFVLFLLLALLKRIKIDQSFLIFILFLSLVLLLQGFVFSFISLRTSFGVYVSIIKAYLAIKIIGPDITRYFTKWLVYFTIISFIFYIPSLFFPSFEAFLLKNVTPFFNREGSRLGYSYVPNFMIYSVNTGITAGYDMSAFFLPGRNPGPFHEAGGFAVYLVPAIGFHLFNGGKMFSFQGVLLTLGLISTFSTAGYAAFAVLIGGHLLFSNNKFKTVLVLPLFLYAGFYAFKSFDFLGAKIDQRIVAFDVEGAQKSERRERFANFLVDMNDAFKYPISGRGANEITRYDNFEGFNGKTHKNNGLSDLAAEYGLVFFVVYFFLLANSLLHLLDFDLKYRRLKSLVLLLVIMLLGFSQVIFMSFFFLALMFYSLTINSKNEKLSNHLEA